MRANSSKVSGKEIPSTPLKDQDQTRNDGDQTFAREQMYQTADAFNVKEIDDPIELFDVEQ